MISERIVVTGAGGFIGAAICKQAFESGARVVGLTRRSVNRVVGDIEWIIGDVREIDWGKVLCAGDIVIHCAALASSSNVDPKELQEVNVDASLRLAIEAAKSQVRRLVFLSSAKILGALSPSRPLNHEDPAQPNDDYAESKWKAEKALVSVAETTALEVVIVRPPLVVGPGVNGNLGRLISAVASDKPLPFGSIDNKRSLVHVDDLAKLIVHYLRQAPIPIEPLLVSSGEDLSTREIIEAIGLGLKKRPRLFPISPALIRFGAFALGRSRDADRLVGSFQVDRSRTEALTGWTPTISSREAIVDIARSWLPKMAS